MERAKQEFKYLKNSVWSYAQYSGYSGSVELFVPVVLGNGQVEDYPMVEYIEKYVFPE